MKPGGESLGASPYDRQMPLSAGALRLLRILSFRPYILVGEALNQFGGDSGQFAGAIYELGDALDTTATGDITRRYLWLTPAGHRRAKDA